MLEETIESQKFEDALSISANQQQIESTGSIPESAEQNERLNIEQIQGLLIQESFDPVQKYNVLSSYVKSRANLLGVNKPVNLFLRSEHIKETSFGSVLQKFRQNPINQEPYTGDWPWTTRAFHSSEGTFLDFPAHPVGKPQDSVLEGYEAADSIIDFVYTCEHELQHDLQDQRIESQEVSYDVLRLVKDKIFLGLRSHFNSGNNFYLNAHNDLFIEQDANNHANDFILKFIPIDGSLSRRIVNPNDPSGHQHTVESVLSQRAEEGVVGHHDEYSLSLGENEINIPPQEYKGSAEQIVSDFCDTVLKIYPDYIKLYPSLALEYNEDGSRRSLSDINNLLEEAELNGGATIGGQKIDSSRLRSIYHRITKHSRKLQEEISNNTL